MMNSSSFFMPNIKQNDSCLQHEFVRLFHSSDCNHIHSQHGDLNYRFARVVRSIGQFR
uniref:Uncharacterized protein n=1 Tax=Arundo donax TaxID=35708 RepID=A0A0A9HQC8_ARUDO